MPLHSVVVQDTYEQGTDFLSNGLARKVTVTTTIYLVLNIVENQIFHLNVTVMYLSNQRSINSSLD